MSAAGADELVGEASRPPARPQPSQPDYGIVVAKDATVPMRDGVRLATDIYYPAIDGLIVAGRWPTVLGPYLV